MIDDLVVATVFSRHPFSRSRLQIELDVHIVLPVLPDAL